MKNLILSILFPRACFGCGRWGSYLCRSCRRRIHWIGDQWCLICEKRSEHGQIHHRCRRPGGIDGIISCMIYKGIVKRVMRQLKYYGRYDAFEEFETLLVPHIAAHRRWYTTIPDLVIQPVPLHPARQRRRGFNQAMQFARLLARTLNLPIVDLVSRTRDTMQQVHTDSRVARSNNIRSAFRVRDPQLVKDKTFLVVDDIYTTGSTINEICRTLKRAGAREVHVWTVARAYEG